MEGAPRAAKGNDADDNGVQILQNLGGGNAKCAEPDLGKPPIADRVAPRSVAALVRFAIDFDGEPYFETGEIQTIAKLGVLAPKAKTCGFLAEFLPEQDFG